ncbi:hypothetical protein N9340_02520, partial [Gammaproteobacteria bacterium]|nr:hypothetical protein [Gammaproteobacteria bacterium]
ELNTRSRVDCVLSLGLDITRSNEMLCFCMYLDNRIAFDIPLLDKGRSKSPSAAFSQLDLACLSKNKFFILVNSILLRLSMSYKIAFL